jgi:hypothetical protein
MLADSKISFKFGLNLQLIRKIEKNMIRTIYTPKSNLVSFPIPEKYIGTELEIMIFPRKEISEIKSEKKIIDDVDLSFGAWADMEKSTEEICSEIRKSRTFRKRDIVL